MFCSPKILAIRHCSEWEKNFLRRHKGQIGIRKATNIRRSRAAVSLDQIKEYFLNLERDCRTARFSHFQL